MEHARHVFRIALLLVAGLAVVSLGRTFLVPPCWAYRSGRIPKRLYATASSPEDGVISSRPRW